MAAKFLYAPEPRQRPRRLARRGPSHRSVGIEPGDAVTLSEEATDTGMKNPAEIPPNSNKNWSSSPSNFPPKNDFLRFFSKITSKKTRSKRVLLLY